MSRRRLRREEVLGGALILAVAALVLFWLRGGDGLSPPAPEAGSETEGGPPLPASSLQVPMFIPLGLLVELMDEAVPRSFGSLEERHEIPDNDRAAVAFTLDRGPFQVQMRDNVAVITATADYTLQAFYDPPVLPELNGTCGGGDEIRPRLLMTLEAPISLDEEWSLVTESRLTSLEPLTDSDRDRCRVTFLDLDLTERVMAGARSFLEGQQKTLDSLAAAVPLRSSFEEWWSMLRDPIQLEDSVWLTLGPQAIRRGPVGGSGDTVRVTLALDARPRVVVGPRPADSDTPLPPLRESEVGTGLELVVEGLAEYATASAFLADEVVGTVLERQGRRVRVESFQLSGLGDGRIALAVEISGDVQGDLYFVGTPSVDPVSGTIYVPDLDFDVATDDLVGTAAAWLREIGLRQWLQERARWPAQPAEAWLGDWLRRGINREISSDIRVRGSVDSLAVRSVWARRDQVQVRILARANAEIEILP